VNLDKPIIIRNRPLEHYILSVFSLLAQNKKKIFLKAYGSLIAKTADMINLITEEMLPGVFEIESKYAIEKISVGKNGETYKITTLNATLKQK